METAASFEVRNAPSSYPAVRAIVLPDHRATRRGTRVPAMGLGPTRRT